MPNSNHFKPSYKLWLAIIAGNVLINAELIVQSAIMLGLLLFLKPPGETTIFQASVICVLFFAFIFYKLFRYARKTAATYGKYIPLKHLADLQTWMNAYCCAVKAKKIKSVYIQHGYQLRIIHKPNPYLPFLKNYHLVIGIESLLFLSKEETQALIASLINRTSRDIPFIQHSSYQLLKRLEFCIKTYIQENIRGSYPKMVANFYQYFNRLALESNREYAKHIILLTAKHISAEAYGMAVVKLEMGDYVSNDLIWPAIWRKAIDQKYPKFGIYQEFGVLSKNPIPETYRNKVLPFIYACYDDPFNPTFQVKEQLSLLNVEPVFNIEPLISTGFDAYFSNFQDEIYCFINNSWAKAALADWQIHHKEMIAVSESLKRNSEKKSLSNDEAVDYAYGLRLMNNDLKLAKFILEEVLSRNPDHAYANYQMAVILAKEYDDNCLNYFLRVITLDKKHGALALDQMIKYCYRCNRLDEASRYQNRLTNLLGEEKAAKLERSTFSDDDKLVTADLPELIKSYLVSVLAEDKAIKRAYLVEKLAKFDVEDRIFVVVVETKVFRRVKTETKRRIEEVLLDDGKVSAFALRATARIRSDYSTTNSLLFERSRELL